MLLPLLFGGRIGPVHSVITQALIGASTSLRLPLMLGALTLGVVLRTEVVRPSMDSIERASFFRRSGLRGGGGPGESETERGCNEDAMLDARCSSTGWLAKRRGDGCLISTSLPGLALTTLRTSLRSGMVGSAVISGWLLSAPETSKARFAGCSGRTWM